VDLGSGGSPFAYAMSAGLANVMVRAMFGHHDQASGHVAVLPGQTSVRDASLTR